MSNNVFLGGTCNNSKWRETIMPMLTAQNITYFNPVVDDWAPECQQQELEERNSADICLYCITPKMTGVYSIAEVTDDSNKRPRKTVLVLLRTDGSSRFTTAQWKSLTAVGALVTENGGIVVFDLKDAVEYISEST